MDDCDSKIYLVDDDTSMLESIAFVLQQAGLRSVSFSDPKAFLASSHRDDIACVVIDLSMRCDVPAPTLTVKFQMHHFNSLPFFELKFRGICDQ